MSAAYRSCAIRFSTAAVLSVLTNVVGLAAETEGPQTPTPAGVLEEVVVTAQKRSERLVDTPASITALAPGELGSRGVLRFDDYQAFVPSLSSTGIAPGYNQINIRGVTTGINQLSATTGLYFDETPIGSSTSTALGSRLTPDPDLFEIERIEVLRGPQGTLYGANALGGVIRYILREPSLDQFRGQVQVGLTSTSHGGVGYVTRAAVDMPLIQDRLGLRVSGYYTKDSGYVDNIALGRKNVNESRNKGGRLSLRWAVNDSLSATLSSLYQDRDNPGLGAETVNSVTGKPDTAEYTQNVPTEEHVRTKYQLHSLKLDFDLGFGTLVSATGYGKQESSLAFDFSGLFGVALGVPAVSLPVDNDVKKFTQEVRLASPSGGRWEYILGAFYTREKAFTLSGGTAFLGNGDPLPPPINPLVDVPVTGRYEEYALFASTTVALTDTLRVEIGGRWSHNEQRFNEVLGGILFGPLVGTSYSNSSSENATTFAISPQWKLSPDSLLYVRAAKGFRPGGMNFVPPGGAGIVNPTFGSDTLMNYELGYKAALLDKRLNLSVSAFLIDWRDIQTTARLAGFLSLLNGGKARSQGFEGELRWDSGGLTMSANASFMDATTRDPILSVGALAGDRLPYAPRWSGALSADREFPLGSAFSGYLGASLRLTGSQNPYYSQATSANPANLRLDSYSILDLRAGIRRGPYEMGLFASNVTDKHALMNLQTDMANPITGNQARATIARPRTLGVIFSARF